ncbi:hypothetical protein [Falsibacillus albus]|uniref:Uncharacterized protein n=1 Tax=Falsibacillus albus TaxID=2478915 RepID=A0A3L7JH01_9BACI|nr:hypothetical protein [Falsibacillus albus]RLQ89986.1 hypothetical protein D9X91_22055 [Falsibacillus albus]
MKKRMIFFVLGMVLFLASLPMSTRLVMELVHNQKMKREYKITNVLDTRQHFKGHTIEINETMKDGKGNVDPWGDQIGTADLSVNMDGEEIETLTNYPIQVRTEGLNRYSGGVAFLTLEDKKNRKTQFVILLKETREFQKKLPNGDITGSAPEDKLKYKVFRLDENGDISHESFYLPERDGLQTELLNAGRVAPYPLGYYTDVWVSYPIFFIPFLFPFFTLILGIIFILVSLILKSGGTHDTKQTILE